MPSRRLQVWKPCVICKDMTTEFNYQVDSCNKCKMVFRRVFRLSVPLEPCNCSTRRIQECRNCRFYSCINGGMQINSIKKYREKLSLIDSLIALDNKRNSTFFKYQMTEDLNLDQIMSPGAIKEKDEHVIFTSHDWVLMEIYTTIEFMKGFDLVNLLTSRDLKIFIKNAYFKCAIYFIAMRSYSNNLSFMTFPEKVDVFPEEILNVPQYSQLLLNKIRCRLISKFIEYRVTKEELLLLVSIIFCDQTDPDYSMPAKNIISQYQKIYASALFQYCELKYQQSVPARFAELISISAVLVDTITDLDTVVSLFNLYQPNLKLRQLVKDSFPQS
ncbi:hypothetical protein CRE_25082 [Caenorhabditis remanei]|uniref:NR LBD domain-containing protein n=1 Tax=Caenorhabditis remanei TaxID=31234 RepID=E3LST8_CAERE|nr:hypothetical protein CRE_25082 [Caenorhabditis remanei]